MLSADNEAWNAAGSWTWRSVRSWSRAGPTAPGSIRARATATLIGETMTSSPALDDAAAAEKSWSPNAVTAGRRQRGQLAGGALTGGGRGRRAVRRPGPRVPVPAPPTRRAHQPEHQDEGNDATTTSHARYDVPRPGRPPRR